MRSSIGTRSPVGDCAPIGDRRLVTLSFRAPSWGFDIRFSSYLEKGWKLTFSYGALVMCSYLGKSFCETEFRGFLALSRGMFRGYGDIVRKWWENLLFLLFFLTRAKNILQRGVSCSVKIKFALEGKK